MKTITLSTSTALLCCNCKARLGPSDKLTGARGRDMDSSRPTFWADMLSTSYEDMIIKYGYNDAKILLDPVTCKTGEPMMFR
ncbi:hypothetical protein HanRHA438_Chr11g0523151 [Helianthus annuus]|nr:hypothetical protein HanRHA438_Chr11g0523151 [Helianthus annuus]